MAPPRSGAKQNTPQTNGAKLASTAGRAVSNAVTGSSRVETPSTSYGSAGKRNNSAVGRSNTSSGTAGRSGSSSSYSSGGGYSGSGGGGSYSGSGGSATYSGGGDFGGGGGGASFAPPAPVMEDVTIPDPLENEVYKKQKAELARARADFDAQQGLARSQYNASFDDAQRQLGWRSAVPRVGLRAKMLGEGNDEAGFDPNAQGTAYGDSYAGNQGDFAGRGLFNSGLYAQSVSNLNQNFNDRRGTALRDQKAYMDTQDLNKKNFYGQQDAADLSAREDAINSLISQYGVSRDQVTPGRSNTIQRLASV